MPEIVLDTDVASDLFLGRPIPPATALRLADASRCVTFVTVGEMTEWAWVRSWGVRSRGRLEGWLSQVAFVNCSVEAARIWGTISAAGKRRGRTSPVNDTWIAATCLAEGLPLLTRNVADFAEIARHHGLDLVDAG